MLFCFFFTETFFFCFWNFVNVYDLLDSFLMYVNCKRKSFAFTILKAKPTPVWYYKSLHSKLFTSKIQRKKNTNVIAPCKVYFMYTFLWQIIYTNDPSYLHRNKFHITDSHIRQKLWRQFCKKRLYYRDLSICKETKTQLINGSCGLTSRFITKLTLHVS